LAIKTRSQTGDKDLATTTVHQCRGGVFLPYKELPRTHPDVTIVITQNQWEKVTLKRGRLTQTHQNILESIIVNAEATRKLPDGRFAFLYSPAKVLRYMGITPKHHSWLYDKLSDFNTEIEIETEIFRRAGVLLYEKGESKVPIPGRILPGEKGEKRTKQPCYQLIVFHPFFSRLFDVDVAIHYRGLLPAILKLKRAVTQAVARFCLSHDRVNMALLDILTALGAMNKDTPERTRRHIIKQVRDEIEALEKDFGIELRKMADGREGVFYQKHPKVWFESPEKPIPPLLTVIEAQKSETGQGAATV